jgi:hypothetical protein
MTERVMLALIRVGRSVTLSALERLPFTYPEVSEAFRILQLPVSHHFLQDAVP